jgi:hypothetical protein
MLWFRQRQPAPRGVSPATDPGVHAVSAPAAVLSVVDPLGTSVSLGADPQGSPAGRRRSQVLPRSCPTLRSVSPRQQPSRRHRWALPSRRSRPLRLSSCGCEPRLRLRWRLPTSGRFSAAESEARRCCHQHVRPRAPLGLFLKRAGGVLPRVPSGEAVSVRDRIGGPGRARARSASRPNSDFGEDANLASPDPEDRTRVVSTWGFATALRRSRAGEASGGATSPHPRPGQPFCPKTACCAEAIQTAFSFPGHEVRVARLTYTAGPDHSATNRAWACLGVSAAATLRRSGQPPAPRSCRGVRRGADFRRGSGSLRMWPCTAYLLPFFRGLLRQRTGRDG